jgi:hypothetical protein
MKLDKFETTPFHCEMGGDSCSPIFFIFSPLAASQGYFSPSKVIHSACQHHEFVLNYMRHYNNGTTNNAPRNAINFLIN